MVSTIFQWRWWMTAVGPNIIASALLAVPAFGAAAWKIRREWRQHLARHEHIKARLAVIEERLKS